MHLKLYTTLCMFLAVPLLPHLCNLGGVFWVQMGPAARTQWTTALNRLTQKLKKGGNA